MPGKVFDFMEIGTEVDFTGYFTPKETAGPGHAVQSFSVKSIDTEKRQITAVASSEIIDRDGEIVSLAALKAAVKDYMRNPVILAGHSHRLGDGRSPVVGSVVSYAFKGKDFLITVEFADTALGLEYWSLYKNKHQRAFSIGFRVLDSKAENRDGKHVRVITAIELYEISAVAIPANPAALSKSKSFVQRKQIEREKKRILNDTDAYTDLIMKAERLEDEHGDVFGNIPADSAVWKQFSPAEMELLKELEAAAVDFAKATWDGGGFDDEDDAGEANAGLPDDWDEDYDKALSGDPAACFDEFETGGGDETDYTNYF